MGRPGRVRMFAYLRQSPLNKRCFLRCPHPKDVSWLSEQYSIAVTETVDMETVVSSD